MSKILGINDIGYGILIERDAGFITHEINKHLFINESTFKEFEIGEPILIDCILQKWGVLNKNGRIYPKEILIPQVDYYLNNCIKNNSSVSEADHPESANISLLNISHLIVDAWWGKNQEENILYGKLKLIVSPGYLKYGIVSVVGDKILLYIQNKIKIGISSRGVGSIKDIKGQKIVQNDYELIGFDLVSNPSTPGAYLNYNNLNNSSKKDIEVFNENKIPKLSKNNKIINNINDFINNF